MPDTPYQEMARTIDRILNGEQRPRRFGFALFVFEFGKVEGGRVNYVSNADRPDMLVAVRALLAGTKTQTRRVIKPQPIVHQSGNWSWEGRNGGFVGSAGTHVDEGFPESARYWSRIQPGDRLWVRESGQLLREAHEHEPGVGDLWRDAGFYHSADGEIIAARSYDTPIREWIDDCAKINRPSIHMPRWASRLTLTVTDVRVQRLQEISEGDAIAEGAYCGKASGRFADNYAAMTLGEWHATARGWYANLWGRINGAGSWEANPWVAAYTFDVEARNIDDEARHG